MEGGDRQGMHRKTLCEVISPRDIAVKPKKFTQYIDYGHNCLIHSYDKLQMQTEKCLPIFNLLYVHLYT